MRNCFCYVRLWLRQNNLPFENITIDKGCVNDLPVHREIAINPLSANPTKWSNTLKQFVGKLPTNCLIVLNHFVKLAFKGLKIIQRMITNQLLITSFQIMSQMMRKLLKKIFFSDKWKSTFTVRQNCWKYT